MGRLLGIDYGTKRIGLALSDESRIIASPFDTHANTPEFWNYLDNLIKKNNIDGFVVGRPVHDGENSFEQQVFGFIRKLHKEFPYPIYLQDESLSSKESRTFLIKTGKRNKKLKQNLDRYAAQAILSSFLTAFEKGKHELYKEEE